MSAYEKEGICPSRWFDFYPEREPLIEKSGFFGTTRTNSEVCYIPQSAIKKVLGDRKEYMVYDGANIALSSDSVSIIDDKCDEGMAIHDGSDIAFDGDNVSIVDAMLGGDGMLGMEIACYLQYLVPFCWYGVTNLKILISDYINPFLISDGLHFRIVDGKEEWFFELPRGNEWYDENFDEEDENCESYEDFEGEFLADCEAVTLKNGLKVFNDDRYLIVVDSSELEWPDRLIRISIFKF